MLLSSTTGRLSRTYDFKKAVKILCDAGYDAIDFSSHSSKEFYTDTYNKEFYTEIRKYVEERGVIFNQAHAPFGSSVKDDDARNEEIFKEIVCSMKNASYLGVKNIVVHPCQHLAYDEDNNDEILFEYNMSFYKRLIPYAEEFGIKIALENMWQSPRWEAGWSKIGHSTCSRPDEFIRYIDTLNNERIVGCLDIGHATVVGEDVYKFIKKLGNKRLLCLHVHDVDGEHDTHTLPFFGMTDWDKVMKGLAEIDYKGDLTFEADNFFRGKPEELYADCAEFMQKTGRVLVNKFKEYSRG